MSTMLEDDDRPRQDKGKSRALTIDPNERTPLLPSSSRGSSLDSDAELLDSRQPSLCSKLLSVFFVSLSFCILLLVFLALLVYSYGSSASREPPDALVRRALVVRGPDRIDVLNVSRTDGIWLRVDGRVGVDAGAALGVSTEEDDGLLKDVWKSIGRWGVRRVDRISANLTTITISSEHGHLANITIPPLTFPLTVDPPQDPSWLTPVSVPILIKPTRDVAALARFVRDSWRDGLVNVKATVDKSTVDALNGWLHLTREHVSSTVRITLPLLPPPDNIPVSLLSFLVHSTPTHLALSGSATVVNPLPKGLHVSIPPLPFTISLPFNNTHSTPVANVLTDPCSLTHPNITLSVAGRALPVSYDATTTLSHFLSTYLQSLPNPILISSPFLPDLAFPTLFPAPTLKPQVLRNVTIRNMLVKYSTDGKGRLLASGTVYARVVLPRGVEVGLEVKRILPDVLVFDGEVQDDDDIDSTSKRLPEFPDLRIPHLPWPTFSKFPHMPDIPRPHLPRAPDLPHPHIPHAPDLPHPPTPRLPHASDLPLPALPFPLPIGHKTSPPDPSPPPPPEQPLPDPLPPRAFAHIRPSEWLATTSTPVDKDGEGTIVDVEAKIEDVPLEMLPGRDKEFRNFMGKVIFTSQGALAGVQGTAAVRVRIQGLPFSEKEGDEMELAGLPFEGKVRIGKRGLLRG